MCLEHDWNCPIYNCICPKYELNGLKYDCFCPICNWACHKYDRRMMMNQMELPICQFQLSLIINIFLMKEFVTDCYALFQRYLEINMDNHPKLVCLTTY